MSKPLIVLINKMSKPVLQCIYLWENWYYY